MKQNAVETGFTDAHAAGWIPPTTTFASPPASPATGAVYLFTDALTPGAAVGGGTALSTCRWSGSAWVAIGGAGGAGGGGNMNFRGNWDGATAYAVGDVVLYSGGLYYRKVPASGGYAHVQSTAITNSHSRAFASNVTVGNLLVVAFHDEGTVDPSTVTDTLGTVYTKAAALTGQANNAAIYYGIALSSGPCTVSYTTGGGWYGVVISEFAGVSATVNATATNYTSTSPHTVSITTTIANCLIYVVVGGQHSACTYSAIAGITLAAQAGGHDAIASGYRLGTTATSYTVGLNQSGDGDDNSPVVAAAFSTAVSNPAADTASWTLLSDMPTAKGGLMTYDTVVNELPVGTDGQVLTADSTQAKGIKWAASAGGAAKRGFGATFDGSGAMLAAPLTTYINVPLGGTISVWTIIVDAGTCTIKLWKVAAGTAIPTASNSINTSGVAITTGTVLRSTTLTDFTTTTVANGDIVGIHLEATSGAKQITFTVELT